MMIDNAQDLFTIKDTYNQNINVSANSILHILYYIIIIIYIFGIAPHP